MAEPSFERSVFINCPFDGDYDPILRAIFFCVVYLGFYPRLATERRDSLENRVDKIWGLLRGSKYCIHDLSRCRASKKGEYFRMNIPFELGMDFGLRQLPEGAERKCLILESKPYRYKKALSDLSGIDVCPHGGDHEKAVEVVRTWLVSEASAPPVSVDEILFAYADFQEPYSRRSKSSRFSDYPTNEILEAIRDSMK